MSTSIETIPVQHGKRINAWALGGWRSHRLLFLVPAIILLGLSVTFTALLGRDPKTLTSALIGKPVPNFSLAPVLGRSLGLASSELKGQPSLVNVFASWCTACRAEHPLFMDLKQESTFQIHGLNNKDRPKTLGQPFLPLLNTQNLAAAIGTRPDKER